MLLSFCITNMNRTYQLKQTLKKNLEDNKLVKDKIEFIVVDFNSNDGCKEYILENFKEELKSDYLKFYWTDELISWHSSIAKNTAHSLANGKYVTNLDCDNFVGELGAEFILDIIDEEAKAVDIPQEFQEMLSQRQEARKNKDWALSDQLRDQILKAGYVIEDTPQGPRLKQKESN